MTRWLAALVLTAGAALAGPDASLRPEVRPAEGITLQPSDDIAIRPRDSAATSAVRRGNGPEQSLKPKERPRKFRRIARAQERLRARGAVCQDIDIQGKDQGRVKSARSGCGIANAVQVRVVSGVTLSQPSLMDCNTAKALKAWIEDTAKPALARKGGGLKQLRVAAHFACRTRNNLPGARISEHGKGRAIDISGVQLQDGTLITVQSGWKNAKTSDAMRKLHSGACGPFGTVLGPESDRFHRDHFHFDTARYRSGPYCR